MKERKGDERKLREGRIFEVVGGKRIGRGN